MGFMGHIVRGAGSERAACVQCGMAGYRDSGWWATQQQSATGVRRAGRFFPNLMNWERNLSASCSGDWKAKAVDRPGWKGLEQAWVDRMDVEWASGRQNCLRRVEQTCCGECFRTG